MPLTKATFDMIQGNIANVLDYGADSSGASDSSSAFQAAINANPSGTVFVPAGTYRIDSIVYVNSVNLLGTGLGTIIRSFSSSDAFRVGAQAPSSGLRTGGGVSDMQIEIKSATGIAVRLMQTQNAYAKNLYIFCDVARPHTARGISLDGGNQSGFFNIIQNINCVGVDIGFISESTGSGFLTANMFIDVSAITYSDNTNSIGMAFNGNNGLDSTIIGGNFESCKKGIRMATDANWATTRTQGLFATNTRFEANYVCDIDWGNGGFRNTFLGYGNFGNSPNPGFNASLNYDGLKENVVAGNGSGTWTPTLVSSGATFSYASQLGYYYYSSAPVAAITIVCSINAEASGTVTNQVTVDGLPFAARNVTGLYQTATVGYAQGASTAIAGYINPNSTSIILTSNGGGVATPTTLAMNGTSRDLVLSATYLV